MACTSGSRCFCSPAEIEARGCPWGLAPGAQSAAGKAASGPLARLAIFQAIEPSSLARLAAASRTFAFAAGDLLVDPAAETRDLLVVEEGRVGLLQSRGGLWDQALAEVGPGYPLNLAAAIDQGAAAFSARALTDGRAMEIQGVELRALVGRNPTLAKDLLMCLAGQCRSLATLSGELSLLTLEERLVRFILRHAGGDRTGAGPHAGAAWSFTHEEVAASVGGSREEVTRLLGRLKRKGLIDVRRRSVSVRDRISLARHAPRA